PIFWVSLQPRRRHLGRLLVSRARHHQPHQPFHVPTALHEIDRQPIQQFGMRRLFALHAKILRRPHKARAKKLLPESIHRHASRQRILRVHQPAGESKSICRRIRWKRRQSPRSRRLHFLAALIVKPARQHERLPRLLHIPHHHHARNRIARSVPLLHPFPQLFQFLRVFRRFLFQRRNLILAPVRRTFLQDRFDAVHLFLLLIGRWAGLVRFELRYCLASCFHFRVESFQFRRLLLGRPFQVRRLLRIAPASIHRRLVKERGQTVIILARQRIELVIVTPATIERQPQPHRSHRLRHIQYIFG